MSQSPPLDQLAAYKEMVLIRTFEEEVERQYKHANIGGYCHLCSGQEATTVGAVAALNKNDLLIGSYRTHGLALAKGVSPEKVMAELYGKVTGCAHGRGGSMHILDVPHQFYGGWGIVAGQLPIATGLALARKQTQQEGVVLCELGDAATNMGAWHESLNLAAIWKLPVVFLLINNGYGMGTSVAKASGEPDLYKRGAAYRIHGEQVDGQNLDAVYAAASRLLDVARQTGQPAILECMTYRYRGHSVADPGTSYRTQAEIAAWKAKDPIVLYGQQLALPATDIQAIAAQAEQTVLQAVTFAADSPAPADDSLREHVYGDGATAQQFTRMNVGAPYGESY